MSYTEIAELLEEELGITGDLTLIRALEEALMEENERRVNHV